MTNIRFTIVLILLSFTGWIRGQSYAPKYWIGFTNKANSPYSINSPQDFLSQRSIERRERQGIAITEQDLPVDPIYIDSLRALGISIIDVSKWMNGVIAQSNDSVLMDTLDKLTFIKATPKIIEPAQNSSNESFIDKYSNSDQKAAIDYGMSKQQIEMVHGEYLHEKGYQGNGMLIAIEDAGFTNADSISSLQHIYQDGKVIATRDFVKDTSTLYHAFFHGTIVFSIIGGYLPNTIYGSAIDADFALIRTENASSEYVIEEYNWVCGAEFADSLGADVINTSLGYSLFDDPSQDHTYKDMNGKTNVISIGADIAVSKGMVVVVSAGNEGNKPWQKITAPADAFNVITVGAVDRTETITSFSSLGPTSDGRIKPDVCALGSATVSQAPNDVITGCYGTSCSSPIITGLTACLWEANPQATSLQIVKAIRESGSQYDHPDTVYGYGIANFELADRLLKQIISTDASKVESVTGFPNPVQNNWTLEIVRPSDNISQESATITFYDLMGQELHTENRTLEGQFNRLAFDNLTWMPTGICLARVKIASRSFTLRIVKIQ